MKITHTFLVILLLAAAVFSYADSEENVADTKNRVVSKTNGGSDIVNLTLDRVKNVKKNNDSKENQEKKMGGDDQKGELKENRESNLESKKESKEVRLPTAREKCDSSSNRCTDNDKALVACLRVPGNESPALSLLIQNMGKSSLSITISAPDLVQLEKKQIELQENKDTEVKVSIRGVESGHFIVLTAGNGNCSLNFRDQFVGIKKSGDSHDSSHVNNIFNLTLSKGLLSSAVLLLLVVSIFMSTKLGRKYFARKAPKYQRLDMELPVSHGSKIDSDENEGWDDSWGDNWDDEETPITPTLPVTPSVSSKGIASRKFSKEGWKD